MTQQMNRKPTDRRTGRSAATTVAAVLAAIGVWAVSVPVAGIDLTVGAGPQARTIGPASVAVTALLAGAVGWALLAFLQGRTRRGTRTWRITAWTVLGLSLLGPLSMGAAGGTLVSLIVMHVAVGVTLIVGLAPADNRRPTG
jgi:hypothetical protein